MSRAFMKEPENDWLGDVPPTIEALRLYLSRENGGIRVEEVREYTEDGRTIHEMSNGECYSLDHDNRWRMIF